MMNGHGDGADAVSEDGTLVYSYRNMEGSPGYWIPEDFPHAFLKMDHFPSIIELENWCQDHIGGNGELWFSDHELIFIKLERDALAFRMRWF